MKNHYGVTITVISTLGTVLSLSSAAGAETKQDDFQGKKATPQSQLDAIKKLPPDVVMDSATSLKSQTVLEPVYGKTNFWSGNNFHAGLHK
jgi:hypothetical protein